MVTELNESNFDSFVESNHIAIIDCWAPWCGPCRRMGPIIEEVAADLDGKIVQDPVEQLRPHGTRKLHEGDIEEGVIRFKLEVERALRHFFRDTAADVYFGNH